MKKADVIAHFGNQEKTALALGVKQSSVSRWENEIPALRAFEIERITNGALKAEFTPPQQINAQ